MGVVWSLLLVACNLSHSQTVLQEFNSETLQDDRDRLFMGLADILREVKVTPSPTVRYGRSYDVVRRFNGTEVFDYDEIANLVASILMANRCDLDALPTEVKQAMKQAYKDPKDSNQRNCRYVPFKDEIKKYYKHRDDTTCEGLTGDTKELLARTLFRGVVYPRVVLLEATLRTRLHWKLHTGQDIVSEYFGIVAKLLMNDDEKWSNEPSQVQGAMLELYREYESGGSNQDLRLRLLMMASVVFSGAKEMYDKVVEARTTPGGDLPIYEIYKYSKLFCQHLLSVMVTNPHIGRKAVTDNLQKYWDLRAIDLAASVLFRMKTHELEEIGSKLIMELQSEDRMPSQKKVVFLMNKAMSEGDVDSALTVAHMALSEMEKMRTQTVFTSNVANVGTIVESILREYMNEESFLFEVIRTISGLYMWPRDDVEMNEYIDTYAEEWIKLYMALLKRFPDLNLGVFENVKYLHVKRCEE
ncbi:hypothetical protein Pmani_036809 [Petrolisthes manimaculis]|uniref:Uncharacterized protein n=1 Tax=Petrolisthes manimaculis TaxID=1843537 RepID=A0AAE1NJG1_9EUCA|nr:hypothetical protein Pmani_036809 [Petrolisthes manimaculis]